ncbi:hypothetical protein [Nocardia tengchongensis]
MTDKQQEPQANQQEPTDVPAEPEQQKRIARTSTSDNLGGETSGSLDISAGE